MTDLSDCATQPSPPVRFQVQLAFILEPRNLYVVCGIPCAAPIRKGMHLMKQGSSFAVIHSIEFVRIADAEEYIGITIPYQNSDRLQALKNLQLEGQTIEIRTIAEASNTES